MTLPVFRRVPKVTLSIFALIFSRVGLLRESIWIDAGIMGVLAECPNWVKKLKNLKVDFGKMSGLCSVRVRDRVRGAE